MPTSSGVCGQCESVRLTRGLIGTSGGGDGGDDSAGNGFPRAFLSALPLPPPVSPPSTSSVCPQSPRNPVTICLEPLSSAFGLKPLQTELKSFCQKKKNQRRAVRVFSGTSPEATLIRCFLQDHPFTHHGPVSENQPDHEVQDEDPELECSAAHSLS